MIVMEYRTLAVTEYSLEVWQILQITYIKKVCYIIQQIRDTLTIPQPCFIHLKYLRFRN